jgi:hypothetical protein
MDVERNEVGERSTVARKSAVRLRSRDVSRTCGGGIVRTRRKSADAEGPNGRPRLRVFQGGHAARALCGVVGAEWTDSDSHVANTDMSLMARRISGRLLPNFSDAGDEHDVVVVVVVIAASRRETPVSSAQVPVSQENRTVRIRTSSRGACRPIRPNRSRV